MKVATLVMLVNAVKRSAFISTLGLVSLLTVACKDEKSTSMLPLTQANLPSRAWVAIYPDVGNTKGLLSPRIQPAGDGIGSNMSTWIGAVPSTSTAGKILVVPVDRPRNMARQVNRWSDGRLYASTGIQQSVDGITWAEFGRDDTPIDARALWKEAGQPVDDEEH